MTEIRTIIPVNGINNKLDHYNGFDREAAALGGKNLGILQYHHGDVAGFVKQKSYDKDAAYSELTGQSFFADGTTPVAARTLYIGPVLGESGFSYYDGGQFVTQTAGCTIQLPDDNVARYIYFDDDGNLSTVSQDKRDLIVRQVLVALVLNDPTGGINIIFADERHGNEMPGQTHLRIHTIDKFMWAAGLWLNGCSGENDATFTSIDAGFCTDEDIRAAILSVTSIQTIYKLGQNWTLTAASNDYAMLVGGVSQVNEIDGAGNGTLADVTGNDRTISSFWATNSNPNQIVRVPGQDLHTSAAHAKDWIGGYMKYLRHDAVISPEFTPLFSFISKPDGTIDAASEGEYFFDHRGHRTTGWYKAT